MKNNISQVKIHSSAAEYLTYVAAIGDNNDSMEMRYENENIWLTQKMIATLYDVNVRTINEYIRNILSDGELDEGSTIRKFRIVQTEGERQVNRDLIHYNLQMNTLNVSCRVFVRYDYLKECFIRKLQIYILQLLIMIELQKQQDYFFKQCRTKCIGQFIDTLRLNLL